MTGCESCAFLMIQYRANGIGKDIKKYYPTVHVNDDLVLKCNNVHQ